MTTQQGQQQCTFCHGQGTIHCDRCKSTGELVCPKCKAIGKMPCQECSNTGWHSHLFLVAMKATSSFSYERAKLPDRVCELIDEYKDRLVLEEHIEARVIDERSKDHEVETEKEAASDEFIIPYEVKLPWGDLTFLLKKKEVEGHLFGLQPLIKDLDPILEQTMAKGLKSLSSASRGKGKTVLQIQSAIRYRAIADTFVYTLTGTPKKALRALKTKYSCGISDEALKTMITQADHCTKSLTIRPRIIGLAIGGVLNLALLGAYFFADMRETLITQTGQADIVIDMLLIMVTTMVCTGIMQFKAAYALKNCLGKILEKSDKKVNPKISRSLVMSLSVTAVLFIVLAIISSSAGHTSPSWLPF